MNKKSVLKSVLVAPLVLSVLYGEAVYASEDVKDPITDTDKPHSDNKQSTDLNGMNEATVVDQAIHTSLENESNEERQSAVDEKQLAPTANDTSAATQPIPTKEEASSVEETATTTEHAITEPEEFLAKEKGINGEEASGEKKEEPHKVEAPAPESSKTQSPKTDQTEDGRSVYIVEYNDDAGKEKIKQELGKLENTEILYDYNVLFKGNAIKTTPENMEKLKRLQVMKSVERAREVQPMMNNARKEIGVEESINYLKAIGAASIINKFDGRGTVIANIDTGVDHRHKAMRLDDDAKPHMKIKKENLKGTDKKYWVSDKIPHAFNYYTGSKVTMEKYDDGSDYHDPHGMHIAGILAGNDTDEDIKKNNGIDGIAPNAQIFSYKMYSDSGSGFAGDETMFHAFEHAIKNGVDVVSISSGFTGTGLVGEKYWEAIRALRKAGIPVVVATGNYATSSSSSSWDNTANNSLKMTDTGNVTRTAAHEDAIAVASARNTEIQFNKLKINDEDFKYTHVGAFFDKDKIVKENETTKNKFKFVYIGKGRDEDVAGLDLKGKIAVMDRIYTKDLKHAFKRAKDKGARAVMLVNTVSYYNRDNWTDLPAMGYEGDTKTDAQVMSVSGEEGLKLWNMISPNKKTDVKKNDIKDFKGKEDQYYPIDMESFNANKPNVGDEKELTFNFSDEKAIVKNQLVPAGSTSWGPRVDLLLKPDVSAPGKNIKSTLNVINGKSTYGYMSGTSMAAPVVAAASALIKPKIQELLKTDVLKNLTGDDKIDFTTLNKIVLQNTATPMMDPTTWGEAAVHYASPRQQGAGLINVAKALKNNVLATFKNTDSKGLVNSYGSISLKEVKHKKRLFSVNLHNTSNRDLTFKVSASPVTTDGIVNKLKLDETYQDEKSKDGKKIVPEIHPTAVNNAGIEFEKDTFTIKANSSYELKGILNLGDAHGKNQFVESFINFESVEEAEDKNNPSAQPSLTMPLMGFAGDWNKEPILDKWAWEEGSRAKSMEGVDDTGKPKIPGTLNKGQGGEHDLDMFTPTGVIQNRKDGKKTSLDQDPDIFAFNNHPDLLAPSKSGSKIIHVTPVDKDGNLQEASVQKDVTPSPLVLRSALNGEISIVNNTGENGQKQNTLKVLSKEHFVRGILNSKRNDSHGIKSSGLKVWGDLKWDGLIYNPRGKEGVINPTVDSASSEGIQGQYESIAEGQYYFKFKYRLTKDHPWQESYIPVKIDNTPPEIVSVDFSNPSAIRLLVKDTYHRAKEAYKNDMLFHRDQVLHPDKFEKVNNKVWYAGAAIVDQEGRPEKMLDVVYAGEGEGKNRLLDNDGNTVYEIRNAGDLRGKILEVVALDGASNFTKIHRIKFANKADSNGKIAYYLVDPDVDSSKYVKLGEIDESKLLEGLKKPAESAVAPDKETTSEAPTIEDTTQPTGESEITINKEVSTIRDFETSDLKKKIKLKYKEINDFVNGGTKKVIMDYNYDNNYQPISYEDGSELEYEVEDKENLKDFIGVVNPSASGSFEIMGHVTNATSDASAYISNGQLTNKIVSKYDPATQTLTFDLYGNVNDIVNGMPYAGDMSITIQDGRGNRKVLKVRMPKNKVEERTVHPYASQYGNIIELGQADLRKLPTREDAPLSTNTVYEDEKQPGYYILNDKIYVRDGYALKLSSYNPGKTDMIDSNGAYSKEDIKKIIDSEPNMVDMTSKWVYGDSRLSKDGRTSYDIRFKTQQGFNILRYQVFKIKTDDQKRAIDKDGQLIDTTSADALKKLVLMGEDDKVYKGELGDVAALSEEGKVFYLDTKPVELQLDRRYFNPSHTNKLYLKKGPFYLRGRIGDKGGFNWQLRVNESIIEDYLIYGDLHIDNSRPFNVELKVANGDVMDWGIKDYKSNGFPDVVYDLEGKPFLKAGENGNPNKAAVGVHYQFFYDNKKPEINLELSKEKNGQVTLTYGEDKYLNLTIQDLRDDGKAGEIQEYQVYVNGQKIDNFDLSNQKGSFDMTVVAKDYAGNTKVEKYHFDAEKETLTKLADEAKTKTTIAFKDNSQLNFDVVAGEDFVLPDYTGVVPENKLFAGYRINNESKLREAGETIISNLDAEGYTVEAVFKDRPVVKEPEYIEPKFPGKNENDHEGNTQEQTPQPETKPEEQYAGDYVFELTLDGELSTETLTFASRDKALDFVATLNRLYKAAGYRLVSQDNGLPEEYKVSLSFEKIVDKQPDITPEPAPEADKPSEKPGVEEELVPEPETPGTEAEDQQPDENEERPQPEQPTEPEASPEAKPDTVEALFAFTNAEGSVHRGSLGEFSSLEQAERRIRQYANELGYTLQNFRLDQGVFLANIDADFSQPLPEPEQPEEQPVRDVEASFEFNFVDGLAHHGSLGYFTTLEQAEKRIRHFANEQGYTLQNFRIEDGKFLADVTESSVYYPENTQSDVEVNTPTEKNNQLSEVERYRLIVQERTQRELAIQALPNLTATQQQAFSQKLQAANTIDAFDGILAEATEIDKNLVHLQKATTSVWGRRKTAITSLMNGLKKKLNQSKFI